MNNDYVVGNIVWQGQKFRVRVRWCYLVLDTIAWATAIKRIEEENEADALKDGDLEFVQMARKTVEALEDWLLDFKPITLAQCPHSEFWLRSIMHPSQVDANNFEAYIDNLLERCEDAQQGENIQFYFHADKKLLVWLDDMPRPVRHTSKHIKLINPGFSGASAKRQQLKKHRNR